jgi:CubicO group peptidase (beta-lactamase class C family)
MSAPIRTLLERAVAAGLAPAAAARWGRAGLEPRSAVVGLASLGPDSVPAAETTLFDLASLTKPLAATTLSLLAIGRGAIQLETRVSEILIELDGAPIGEIRVHELLTHTGGLPAWLPLYCVADGDPARLTSSLRGVEVAQPGGNVVYSCIGFVVLGKMLEAISGGTLETLFRREVAGPLGVTDDIGFRPEPGDSRLAGGAHQSVVERRMVLEMGLDPRLIPPTGPGLPDDGNARFLGGVAGNAGLFGTLDGVFAVAREWIGPDRKILTGGDVDRATTPRTGGLEQTRGLGWQMARSPGCSAGPALHDRAYGHTGFTGVSLWIDPVNAVMCSLLTNRNHPSQRETELHPLRRRFHALAIADQV